MYFYLTFIQAEIIPENFRKKVEEEEKSKEMEDLYLPPRSRKTLQQINQSEGMHFDRPPSLPSFILEREI